MALDKNSIDKEIVRLGVEAHMFWELPKVREALNELCKKWFFNDCKAYSKNTIDISEDSPTLVLLTKFLHHLRLQLLIPKRKKNNVSNWVL